MRFDSKKRDKNKGKRREKKSFADDRFGQKKCRLCGKNAPAVDYKNTELLTKFVTEHGKIMSARITGNCAKHQRHVMRAIKRARAIGFLPYAAE